MKNQIDLNELKKAIEARHHAMERFFDIEAAEKDRDLNLEMLVRLEKGEHSNEDIEAALDILNYK